jgi:hypothetical protein
VNHNNKNMTKRHSPAPLHDGREGKGTAEYLYIIARRESGENGPWNELYHTLIAWEKPPPSPAWSSSTGPPRGHGNGEKIGRFISKSRFSRYIRVPDSVFTKQH